jgi:hypothetical protein
MLDFAACCGKRLDADIGEMRPLILVIYILFGIGQNLPINWMYVHGVGAGDFLFLLLFLFMMLHTHWRAQLLAQAVNLRELFLLLLAFVTFTVLSAAANVAVWDINGEDLIEALRPMYYFALIFFTSVVMRRDGVSVVIAYLIGILISALVAYLFSTTELIDGFVVLWNPNVIGNMLAVGGVFVSILIFERRFGAAIVFLISFLVLSVFTFSKGTWLMMLLSLSACLVAYSASVPQARRVGRNIFAAGCFAVLGMVIYKSEALYELVTLKIATTQFGDSAAEGGTAAARWGYVQASARLAIENPIFGIGISNFGTAYDSLQNTLGDNYWRSDNPHSAWLYILVCIGTPAVVIFGWTVTIVLNRLRASVPLMQGARLSYVSLIALLFFVSGAVQLQILTQHFFWIFAGVVFGWRADNYVQKWQPGQYCLLASGATFRQS